MGNSNSRKTPPVIATCKAPMYCINKIGGRHLLIGGGGGAAKTGVINQIESHLLYFKDRASAVTSPCAMDAKLSSTIDTGSFSTMNMDVVSVSSERGTYLVAAGHDQYCDVYETKGYSAERGDGPSAALSLKFNPVGRLRTVLGEGENFYQKCVRFDKSTGGKRLVTGGSDGHIRVWNIQNLVEYRNPEVERKSLAEINAHVGVVEDIDISPDGRFFFSVGQDGKTVLWEDLTLGKKVQELPFPSELATGYKVRSVRFTALGEKQFVFVVAYNSIVKNSKSLSFLGLWGFHREKHTFDMYTLKQSGKGESISSLCVSSCGHFTGIGTLAGSVSIFDTHEMKPLLVKPQTHGIFVTGVEFLDREALDIPLVNKSGQRLKVPGAAGDARASLVSLSADQTVQLHCLPFEQRDGVSIFLLKLAVLSLLFYYLIWLLV